MNQQTGGRARTTRTARTTRRTANAAVITTLSVIIAAVLSAALKLSSVADAHVTAVETSAAGRTTRAALEAQWASLKNGWMLIDDARPVAYYGSENPVVAFTRSYGFLPARLLSCLNSGRDLSVHLNIDDVPNHTTSAPLSSLHLRAGPLALHLTPVNAAACASPQRLQFPLRATGPLNSNDQRLISEALKRRHQENDPDTGQRVGAYLDTHQHSNR